MSIYEKLVGLAAKHAPDGYLRAYRGDLTIHDARQLAEPKQGARYIWILRESGTQLFEIASGADAGWVTYFVDSPAYATPYLFFLADVSADTVKTITPARAAELARIPHPQGKAVRVSLS